MGLSAGFTLRQQVVKSIRVGLENFGNGGGEVVCPICKQVEMRNEGSRHVLVFWLSQELDAVWPLHRGVSLSA